MPNCIPISAVIPTRNRAATLRRTLASLAEQSYQPVEVVIVDGSDNEQTQTLCLSEAPCGLQTKLIWQRTASLGAAVQRNQGLKACSHSVIGFFDDDILFEPHCIERLWRALESDPRMGGVNAMIVNQRYQAPGWVSRFVFRLMAGRSEATYAGRVLGPAVNLLPEDRHDLPEVVPAEWLNTTCTLYRREALPDPAFSSEFTGYSLMEDLALSLTVGKQWKLANARTARIFHDSQPGSHKSDPRALAEMQLMNRHFVMTKLLGRNTPGDYLKLIAFELFSMASSLRSQTGRSTLPQTLLGRIGAIRRMAA